MNIQVYPSDKPDVPAPKETPLPKMTPFADPYELSQWAKGLLMASLVLAAISSLACLFELGSISPSTAGATASVGAAALLLTGIVALVQIPVAIATGILFLAWIHRAHRNLPVLGGRGLRFTPGWAVGWFFVPFLNFVQPAQVMTEVWHGSDPGGLERDLQPDGPSARNKLSAPSLVTWWWLLYIVPNIVGYIGAQMAVSASATAASLHTGIVLQVISEALDIPAVLVAIRVVSRVTGLQRERNAKIGQPAPS